MEYLEIKKEEPEDELLQENYGLDNYNIDITKIKEEINETPSIGLHTSVDDIDSKEILDIPIRVKAEITESEVMKFEAEEPNIESKEKMEIIDELPGCSTATEEPEGGFRLVIDVSRTAKSRMVRTDDPDGLWYNDVSSEEDQPRKDNGTDEDGDKSYIIDDDDHNSTHEQVLSDTELFEDDLLLRSNNHFLGKDRITQWKKSCKTRACNRLPKTVIPLPGSKGAAKEAATQIDCLKLFINDTVVNKIVIYTNIYIESISKNFQRDRDARLTDFTEISALIGIFYLIGVFRCARKDTQHLWDNTQGCGIEACYLAMSRKRFVFLVRCLRFDDTRDRQQRKETDKLAQIREIFKMVVNNFQKSYIPSDNLTVDEMMVSFNGRCPFKYYIPRKTVPLGIKVFALVDAKTAYTVNLEVCVGSQPPGPYQRDSSIEDIVYRQVAPIAGTCRNITVDNWFTSLPLAKRLLQEHKLTLVGALRKDNPNIPKEFMPSRSNELYSSKFGFHDECALVSYCSNKNKCVMILSTLHNDASIEPDSGEKATPEMYSFYNKTKIGVDVVSSLCENYDVSTNSKRWSTVLFYTLLNISAINAQCIYKINPKITNKVPRRKFLQTIAFELIKPQIEKRSKIQQIPAELRRRSRLLLGIEEPTAPTRDGTGSSVGRCYLCGRARSKSTRRWCRSCKNWACKDHMDDVCSNCVQNH